VCFDFRSGCCVLRCALHSTLRIFSSRWFVSVPSFCRPLGFSHRYFRFCAPVDFPFSLKPSFLLFVSHSIFLPQQALAVCRRWSAAGARLGRAGQIWSGPAAASMFRCCCVSVRAASFASRAARSGLGLRLCTSSPVPVPGRHPRVKLSALDLLDSTGRLHSCA
jgi:hypothetical protein